MPVQQVRAAARDTAHIVSHDFLFVPTSSRHHLGSPARGRCAGVSFRPRRGAATQPSPSVGCPSPQSSRYRLGEMRAAQLLALLRSVAARLTLVGRSHALARSRCVASGADRVDVGLSDLLRKQSRRRVATRTMMVRGFLVDNDGSDRVADSERLPAGGARAGIAGCDRRLLTDGSEVIVTATCSVPVHLGHRLSLAPCQMPVHVHVHVHVHRVTRPSELLPQREFGVSA
jgi:hypothetical protein